MKSQAIIEKYLDFFHTLKKGNFNKTPRQGILQNKCSRNLI